MDKEQEENKELEELLRIGDITAPFGDESLISIDDTEAAQEEAAAEEAAEDEIAAYDRLQNAKAAAAEKYVEVLKQDRHERGKYADKLFKLICVWLVVISVVIVGSGYKNDLDITVTYPNGKVISKTITPPRFALSDAVLLALIGGTTASVLGLFHCSQLPFQHTQASSRLKVSSILSLKITKGDWIALSSRLLAGH